MMVPTRLKTDMFEPETSQVNVIVMMLLVSSAPRTLLFLLLVGQVHTVSHPTEFLFLGLAADLKEQGLKPGEGCADAQVNLLTSVHGIGIMLIWGDQVGNGCVEVPGDECREAGAPHMQPGVCPLANINHLHAKTWGVSTLANLRMVKLHGPGQQALCTICEDEKKAMY